MGDMGEMSSSSQLTTPLTMEHLNKQSNGLGVLLDDLNKQDNGVDALLYSEDSLIGTSGDCHKTPYETSEKMVDEGNCGDYYRTPFQTSAKTVDEGNYDDYHRSQDHTSEKMVDEAISGDCHRTQDQASENTADEEKSASHDKEIISEDLRTPSRESLEPKEIGGENGEITLTSREEGDHGRNELQDFLSQNVSQKPDQRGLPEFKTKTSESSSASKSSISSRSVKKPSGSVSKSSTKEKTLENPLGSQSRKSKPSALQSQNVRASQPNFTVPRPFALATDKRASLGGDHSFNRLRSFQSSKKNASTEGSKHTESIDNDKGRMNLRASTNSFNFNSNSGIRAERRREFNSKLEEKITAKEVASKQAQAKSKEEVEAEIKQFRKSLSFKASPMPNFYNGPAPPKQDVKKIPPTRAKSPKLGRKSTTNSVSSDSKATIPSQSDQNTQNIDPQNQPAVTLPRLRLPNKQKNVSSTSNVVTKKGLEKSPSKPLPSNRPSKVTQENVSASGSHQSLVNKPAYGCEVSNIQPNNEVTTTMEADNSLGQSDGVVSNAGSNKPANKRQTDIKSNSNKLKFKKSKLSQQSLSMKTTEQVKEHEAKGAKLHKGNASVKKEQASKSRKPITEVNEEELSQVSSAISDLTVAS